MSALPPIETLLAPAQVTCERRADGSFLIRNPEPLGPYARCVGEWVEKWAETRPDAVAIAERENDGWRTLSWSELRASIHSVAQGLLDLGIDSNKPIVMLSENSVDHALLMLGALHVGIPVCAISTAYSLLAKDFGRLRTMLEVLRPSLVYASGADDYAHALRAVRDLARPVLSHGGLSGAVNLRTLLQTPATPAVQAAFEAIRPDDHAKYLLTSGSTGRPKVVVSTHRMLCANQQMIAQVWRFLEHEKPVLVDWLPWSHTFGGSHNVNMVLRNGGTLYVDDGKPTPGGIKRTIQNLRSARPNLLFNVPRGLDMMLPFLEQDAAAAEDVFSNLRVVCYAAAALPEATWQRIENLSLRVTGKRVWLTTGYGSTETAPAATTPHWRLEASGCIGVPYPGLDMKLAPSGEKLEIRLRGVTIFPGYLHDEAKTLEAFDEEGFYCMGDAGRMVDEARPERGVLFDGRVAEDFKLLTGTWVSVGTLRPKLLSAFAPLAQDLVIAGHDRDEIGVLLFPSAEGRQLGQAELSMRIADVLRDLKRARTGSSQLPERVLVLDEPPSIEAGEITDKGYLNQRAVLQRRAAELHELYAEPRSHRVIDSSNAPEAKDIY